MLSMLEDHQGGSNGDGSLNHSLTPNLPMATWEEDARVQQFLLFELNDSYYLRASTQYHFMLAAEFQEELDGQLISHQSEELIVADGFVTLEDGSVLLQVRNHDAFFDARAVQEALNSQIPNLSIE